MLRKDFRRIRKKATDLKILVFFGALFIIGIIAMIIPLRPTKSDVEKRDLAKFPEFTVESFLSGEYFAAIDTWYADTFPFRDQLLNANTFVAGLNGIQTTQIHGKLIDADEIPDFENRVKDDDDDFDYNDGDDKQNTQSGQKTGEKKPYVPETINEERDAPTDVVTQNLGPLFIAGDSAYEYYGFNQESSDGYVAMINGITEKLKGVATVYDIIVPNSMDIALNDNVRDGVATSKQNDAINYMFSSMSLDTQVVPIYKILREHKKEYLYFRTDHHWTATAAYYAYCKFCSVKGIKPNALSSYQTVNFDGFLGSFYAESGQLPEMAANPDTVVGYYPHATNDMVFYDKSGSEIPWNVVYDVSDWAAGSKYNAFIGGDNPLSVISNPNLSDGSSCVVIKESYGNAFVPFLVDHYQTVYVVDYRYYMDPLVDLVKSAGIQDVIFINNVVATGTPDRIGELNHLTR